MLTHPERREHKRYPSQRRVKFLDMGGERLTRISRIDDVSNRGLRLTVSEALEPMTVIAMQFPETFNDRMFSLKAKVVWIRPKHDSSEGFQTGVEFLNAPENAGEIILGESKST